ncbi:MULTISPECIES: MFS transporter [Periweissella]|uniref:MFS transporter n=1 Tax=Periweissella fabalis TaxID=1070421 RepID=A0A7X6N423_9LACO|nr:MULTISPECIES: MFS transporter [Periweissella]MCM0598349.1 MFS transporter [Periweissella fabalis]MCT4396861.1 MFS transporter [Periweissella beninensis]NKZ24969.1 MFS transporter [Periweissella fabalis]
MIKTLRNSAVFGLLGSTFFQVLGISLFNMVLLILAKSSNQSSFWVTIISIATTIPGIMAALLGKVAGSLTNKVKWLIILTFSQSIIYVVLFTVFITSNSNELGIAIVINIVSDIVGVVIGLLKLPIIQNKVPQDFRQQTIGIYQSIGLIMQPIGQAIGVSYITTTGNYAMSSLINAITFCISGSILFLFRRKLSYVEKKETPNNKISNANGFKNAFSLLGKVTDLPIIQIIVALIILNALGASIDGTLNLYVLDNSSISPLNFGLTILLINIVFVIGNVLGSVVVHDILEKYSFKKLLILVSLLLGGLFITLILNLNIAFIVVFLFCITYVLGKINPKLYTMLMNTVDSSSLSIILGVLNSSLTIAAPIGSIFLVGGYTLIGKNNILSFSLVLITIVIILISIKGKPTRLT